MGNDTDLNNLAMSEAALRGMGLFDDLACGTCHTDVWLTDFQTHNIGLTEEYADPGTYRLTFDSLDIGAFKTPSLRKQGWRVQPGYPAFHTHRIFRTLYFHRHVSLCRVR